MAVPVTPYAYVNGNTLVPSGTTSHNINVFSATGDQGVMSEGNGGLDHLNLSGGFQVTPEMLYPGAVFRAEQEYNIGTQDFVDDGVGATDADVSYHTIPGVSTRIFIPFQVTVLVFQWSLFAHAWRMPEVAVGQNEAGVGPTIILKAFLGLAGAVPAAVAHTQRAVPESVYFYDPALPPARIGRQEPVTANPYDLCHMEFNVAAGWHELDYRFLVARVPNSGAPAGSDNRAMDFEVGNYTGSHNAQLRHRLTVGVCNARAIALL